MQVKYPFFFTIAGICICFVQILFFRELLAVFQSNNLAAGFIIAHSILSFFSGMFVSSKIKKINSSTTFFKVFIFCAVLLLICSMVFILNIRTILGISLGGGISLKIAFIYVFAAVFPSLFISGAGLFTSLKICREYISYKKALLFYSAGFIFGGILFFLCVYSFAVTKIILLTAAFSSVGCAVVSDRKQTTETFLLAALLFSFGTSFLNGEKTDLMISSDSFSGASVLEKAYTPYGQTVLLGRNNEFFLLENNIRLFSYPGTDLLNSQDFGHIPILYHDKPKNILIAGSGAEYLPMVVVHKAEKIDFADPDKFIFESIKKNMPYFSYFFQDSRVTVYNEKIRAFLKKSGQKYDVILVGQPSPENIRFNACYSEDFFKTAKTAMKKNGFIAVKLPGTMAFSSYIMAELNKSVADAMKKVFRNVIVIPGSRNIIIASDGRMPYRFEIKKRLYKIQEKTLVLSKYYLDDRMDTERTKWLKDELAKIDDFHFQANTDMNQQSVILSVLHAQAAFSPYLSVVLDKAREYAHIAIFVLIVLFFLSKSPYAATSFVSGASAVWLFITFLFAVEIEYGEIFKLYGLLSALFVSGVTAGAFFKKTNAKLPLNTRMFYGELFSLIFIVLLLCFFKFWSLNIYMICALTAFSGFCCGIRLAVLTDISDFFGDEIVSKSKIFSANVSGALFTAFAGGCFLIAAKGVGISLFFVLLMEFLIFCRWADLKRRGL